MRRERIQNRIGGSIFMLPFCAMLTCLLWWLPQGEYSHAYMAGLVLCALTTYIVVETNNTYSLIRVRSRMVSSVWLLLSACIGLMHPFTGVSISTFSLAVAYYILLRTYQQRQPVVNVFHTYFMLGVGSIFLPQMLYMMPLFLWYLLIFMRSLTFRGFFAAIIGAMLPYIFWSTWSLLSMSTDGLMAWWEMLSTRPVSLEAYTAVPRQVAYCWVVLSIMAIYTSVQYLINSFNDKIRVRMNIYIYVFQTAFLLILVLLQPHLATALLPLMALTSSVCIAHYLTLTRTIWCTIVMFLFLLLLLSMAVVTLNEYTSNIIINYIAI